MIIVRLLISFAGLLPLFVGFVEVLRSCNRLRLIRIATAFVSIPCLVISAQHSPAQTSPQITQKGTEGDLHTINLGPDTRSVVVQWNDALLRAIRGVRMGPPMVARALAIAHTSMYDAWTAYDSRAISTVYRARLKRPKSEQTDANKRMAISYAAYRTAIDLFPNAKESIFDTLFRSLGYDTNDVVPNGETAAGIGNLVANAMLSQAHRDGSNQLGDENESGIPYSDYTGYKPANSPYPGSVGAALVKAPGRFQPLQYRDPTVRALFPQPFLGAQWFRVRTFAGPYDGVMSAAMHQHPPASYGSGAFVDQSQQLVEISAALTDEQKTISEYWQDGPSSELPPGHWCLFAQYISVRDNHDLDEDVMFFFVLTNAVEDAGVVAWTLKRRLDTARPITSIPYLLNGQLIRCWAGPGKGTQAMDGSEWMPYQPTSLPSPPFPEYPSGHSAFSAAAATILKRWTHSDRFEASVVILAKSSRVEPGLTPSTDIKLEWSTFTEAANQAGLSRRYGGIHFESGDLAGRQIGALVGEAVWKKSLKLYRGDPSLRHAAHGL